jgi:hypothetical protein
VEIIEGSLFFFVCKTKQRLHLFIIIPNAIVEKCAVRLFVTLITELCLFYWVGSKITFHNYSELQKMFRIYQYFGFTWYLQNKCQWLLMTPIKNNCKSSAVHGICRCNDILSNTRYTNNKLNYLEI